MKHDLAPIAEKITQLIEKHLPSFVGDVSEHKEMLGDGKYLKIWWAASDKNINDVRGQKTQVVSLSLSDELELHPQVFGGMGGRTITRKPNLLVDAEKYLAQKSVVIPFRTPQPIEEKVLKCIYKFILDYKKALIENIDVLMYQDLVNYKELLEIQ